MLPRMLRICSHAAASSIADVVLHVLHVPSHCGHTAFRPLGMRCTNAWLLEMLALLLVLVQAQHVAPGAPLGHCCSQASLQSPLTT